MGRDYTVVENLWLVEFVGRRCGACSLNHKLAVIEISWRVRVHSAKLEA
jgi:hypothetical protein